MRTATHLCACLALLAIATAAGIVGYQAAVLPDRIASGIHQEATVSRHDLNRQMDATREGLLAEVGVTRRDLFREVREIRNATREELAATRALLDQQASAGMKRLDRVAGSVDAMRADFQPVTKQTTALLASATATSDQLRADVAKTTPFVIGTVAATKVTMGETAKTMRVVAAEAPRTGRALADFSQQAAGIATDVHEATTEYTKPTPWWKKTLNATVGTAIAAGKIFR